MDILPNDVLYKIFKFEHQMEFHACMYELLECKLKTKYQLTYPLAIKTINPYINTETNNLIQGEVFAQNFVFSY